MYPRSWKWRNLRVLRKSSKQLSTLNHIKFIKPEGHSLGHAVLSAYEFTEEPKIYDSALFNTNKRFVRPIIHAKLKVKKNVIVHLFAVHLPSKKDETKETNGIRKNMITFINQEVNYILQKEKNPYIVVMGDFNEENSEQTIYKLKNAYSLSPKPRGSIFYDYWQKVDQILYSDAFKYSEDNPLRIMSFNLFDDVTLLRVSKETGENIPAKFYYHTGIDENQGYSDHLPIAIKVNY